MKTTWIFTKIFFFSGIGIPVKSNILFLLVLNLSYFCSCESNGNKGCTRWSLLSDDKNPKTNDNIHIYTNINKSSHCDKNYTAKENLSNILYYLCIKKKIKEWSSVVCYFESIIWMTMEMYIGT